MSQGFASIASVPVANILDRYANGSSKEYDQFISQLTDPDLQNETLTSYLAGLRDCIFVLGKEYEVLVGAVLKIDWTKRNLDVVKEYKSFILNLVSAHTIYVRACLRMLVRNFSPKLEKSEAGEVILTAKTLEQHNEMFERVHQVLQAIIRIVPMTPTLLLPLLSDYFPFMTKETYLQQCFVKNTLHLLPYLQSTTRPKILEIIIDRMTKLDVRSPRNEILEADGKSDEDEDMEQDDIFAMDDNDKTATKSEDGDVNKTTDTPMCHGDADKLDGMLEIMYTYIHSECYRNGELDWEATKRLYKDLLVVFERVILPTHASCHVQFMIFYICSFRKELYEGFLDYSWKKVLNPNTSSILRQGLVAYIASLVARAKYIPIHTVKIVIGLMTTWIDRYISQATHTAQVDVTYHGPFYSVCQAVFYVIAFRHKELLEMPNGHKYLQSLNFQSIVTSRLNPLKVCLPVIVNTFSSVARIHQLAYCDTIIERNNRSMLPVASSNQSGPNKLTAVNQLDSFFPFDPYVLKRSERFIMPIYQEFQGHIEEDEQDVEDDDDFLPEVQSPPSGSLDILSSGKTPVTPSDLLMYSISPGFKHA